MVASAASERTWLLLVHQLPPEPAALRVRVWRRLQALGALQLKSSVYVLPESADARESFEWLVREIVAAGAEATLLRGALLQGTRDEECIERFRAAASAEYAELASELRAEAKRRRGRTRRAEAGEERRKLLAKAAERLAAVERRDFFGAQGREVVAALLAELEDRSGSREMSRSAKQAKAEIEALRGKVWVTRAGVFVDRMASAWLVRRFVDPGARFRFEAARAIAPAPGEVRFDTFDGEFTHEGERCTFEVICARLGLRAPGLTRIGEIVHDLDLEDGRYDRPETAGVGAALEGIAASTADDLERIERAAVLFDGLLASFAKGR